RSADQRWPETETPSDRLLLQLGADHGHTIKGPVAATGAGCNRACCRNDVAHRDKHRPTTLLRKTKLRHGAEVDVFRDGLVEPSLVLRRRTQHEAISQDS